MSLVRSLHREEGISLEVFAEQSACIAGKAGALQTAGTVWVYLEDFWSF